MMLNRLKPILVFGAICLLIYPVWRMIFAPTEEFRVSQPKPHVSTTVIFQGGEKCQKNSTAAETSDFNDFPQHIQNFLFYQHCRHFPMLLDIPDKCGGAGKSADVFLLLVVKSSPLNYERREVLRKTWAAERRHNGAWIRRIFITGTTAEGHEKRRMNSLLELEHRDYSDILQWDFTDSFYNLTLKQILFLEWMERNCPHARFLLNGDDDVFANTDNMVEYLQNLQGNDGSKHLFTGFLIKDHGPVRWKQSKYYIPVQVYKEDSYFPYCGGGGFLLSSYTASAIYNMSHSISIHPIDDAYLGMCLAKAGLSPTLHIGFWTLGLKIPSNKVDLYDPCYYKDLLVVHRFLPPEMYFMWNKISNPNLKCGRPVKMRCSIEN